MRQRTTTPSLGAVTPPGALVRAGRLVWAHEFPHVTMFALCWRLLPKVTAAEAGPATTRVELSAAAASRRRRGERSMPPPSQRDGISPMGAGRHVGGGE